MGLQRISLRRWMSLAVVCGFSLFASAQESTTPKDDSAATSTAAESDSQNASSANTEDSPTTEEPEKETLERWEFYAPVRFPKAAGESAGNGKTLFDFHLSADIFSRSRSDLGDLRLLDGQGKAIPYALRTLHPTWVRDSLSATEFNRSTAKEGPKEVTLELTNQELQHNEVQIETSGNEFRRHVEIDGSEDGKEWRRLTTGSLLRFSHEKQKIERDAFEYPVSRLRFVRVRVFPDTQRKLSDPEADQFEIKEARVWRQLHVPGERFLEDAKLGVREPVRVSGQPGSSWIIELGGENVPCDRLEVDIADREFARDVQLEVEYPYGPLGQPSFSQIYLEDKSLWQRKPGDAKTPMVLQFHEVQTRRLRLRVNDYRNPPLTIRGVKFGAAARQVVFAMPAGVTTNDATELRLYFGNPAATGPVYDFARNLPSKLEDTPRRVELAASERYERYSPPPLPYTERYPWLIYLVLTAVSALLAAVLFSLARTAIANHDGQPSPPDAASSAVSA